MSKMDSFIQMLCPSRAYTILHSFYLPLSHLSDKEPLLRPSPPTVSSLSPVFWTHSSLVSREPLPQSTPMSASLSTSAILPYSLCPYPSHINKKFYFLQQTAIQLPLLPLTLFLFRVFSPSIIQQEWSPSSAPHWIHLFLLIIPTQIHPHHFHQPGQHPW